MSETAVSASCGLDVGGAGHEAGFSRTSIDAAWSSKPSARAIGGAARASAPRPRPDAHLAHAPAEMAGPRPGGEARRAAGGQRVVGARDVVAEGGRALAADEQAAGVAHAWGERLGGRADELEMLGRGGPRRTRARPRGRLRRPGGARAGLAVGRASSAAGSSLTAGTSGRLAVLGLGQDVARRQAGSAPSPRSTTRSLGRPAVDPEVAEDLALGLRDVEVARGRRSRRRGDGLGPVGQRGDRLRPTHAGRAGCPAEARRRRRSPGTGGEDTWTTPSPAARAAATPITDGARVRRAPSGDVDRGARRTGSSRTRTVWPWGSATSAGRATSSRLGHRAGTLSIAT